MIGYVKLPVLLFAYRTSVHETTGVTPFSMMLGREAQLPEDLIYGLPVGDATVPQGGREYVEHLKKTMQNAYKSIRDEAWKEMQHQKMMKGKMSVNATRKVIVYGSTVLLFQGVIRPSSIDHGRGHMKWKRSLVMWCTEYGRRTLELSNLQFILTDLSHTSNQ